MAYPSTAQELVDRLLVDREFEIRTVVYDNYPAVRANFEEQLQAGQPNLINTPEKLADELVWWDRNQGGRATVDPVLDVPYRASAGSQVLDAAVAQLAEMSEATAGHPMGLRQGITAMVGSLKGTSAESAATTNVKEVEAMALAAANTLAEKAKANRTRVVAAIVAVLAIIALIWYLRQK